MTSIIDHQKKEIMSLTVPLVTGRGTPNQSVEPTVGKLVCDAVDNDLYIGDGSVFVKVSDSNATSVSIVGPIDAIDNQGLRLVGNDLQAQLANSTYPGILSTGTQNIPGYKIFDDNLQTGRCDINDLSGLRNTIAANEASGSTLTGANNVLLGRDVLAAEFGTSASNSIAIGYQSMQNAFSGDQNIAIGNQSLRNNSGSSCVGIGGDNVLASNEGDSNTAVGFGSMLANTTGSDNTALGRSSLDSNTTGVNNTAIGNLALQANTTGNNNTAVGYQSLLNNVSSFNTAIGSSSLQSITTGNNNIAVGYNSMVSSVTPQNNVAVGNNTLALCQSNDNTAIGTNALSLSSDLTAINNTAVGSGALRNLATAASNNTMCGYSTGIATAGSNNTFIGSLSDANSTPGNSNQIYIGYNANPAGQASNCVSIGDANITSVRVSGLWSNPPGGTTKSVYVNANGVIGSSASIRSVKNSIVSIDSETNHDIIMGLKPSTFCYNADHTNTKQFGMIVDEVEQVMPEMLTYANDGTPDGLQYQIVPIMNLAEIQRLNGLIDQLDLYNQELLDALTKLTIRVAALESS